MREKIKIYILITLFIFCSKILAIPINNFIAIFVWFTVKNFWVSLLITAIPSILASLFTYWVFQTSFAERIRRKFENDYYFEVLFEESKRHPFKTALIGRILFIPESYKDYFLSLINIPFKSYLITALVFNTYFCSEILILSMEFTEFKSLIHEDTLWAEKPIQKKISIVISFIFILLTVLTVFYLGYICSKKIKKKSKILRENRKISSESN